jgi:transcriptional regulator with XRE-family HTH domain
LRAERDWSLAQLAQRIGKQKSVLSSYEKGLTCPPTYVLLRLAQAFSVPTRFFLEAADEAAATVALADDAAPFAAAQELRDIALGGSELHLDQRLSSVLHCYLRQVGARGGSLALVSPLDGRLWVAAADAPWWWTQREGRIPPLLEPGKTQECGLSGYTAYAGGTKLIPDLTQEPTETGEVVDPNTHQRAFEVKRLKTTDGDLAWYADWFPRVVLSELCAALEVPIESVPYPGFEAFLEGRAVKRVPQSDNRQQVIGVLIADHDMKNGLARARPLARALAPLVALAILTSHQQSSEASLRRARQAVAQARAAPQRSCEIVVDCVRESLNWDFCSLFKAETNPRRLELVATTARDGLAEWKRRTGQETVTYVWPDGATGNEPGIGLTVSVFLTGEPIVLRHTLDDSRHKPERPDGGGPPKFCEGDVERESFMVWPVVIDKGASSEHTWGCLRGGIKAASGPGGVRLIHPADVDLACRLVGEVLVPQLTRVEALRAG